MFFRTSLAGCVLLCMSAVAQDDYVASVLAKLRSPDANVRAEALDALARPGSVPKEAFPVLIEILEKDPEEGNRTEAVLALKAMKRDARDALPQLMRATKASCTLTRLSAVEALGDIDVDDPAVVDALTGALGDSDPQVKRAAFDRLARVPSPSAAVVDTLVKVLSDSSSEYRSSAFHALRNAGPEAVPEILKYMGAALEHERKKMAANFSWNPQMRPALLEALKAPEADLRACAVLVLGSMPESVKENVPVLAEVLKDPEVQVRKAAAGALGFPADDCVSSVTLLMGALTDSVPEVRATAIGTLQEVKKDVDFEPAVPALVAALKDPDARVRLEAVRCLRRRSKVLESIAPDLQQVTADTDLRVATYAAEGVARVRPDVAELGAVLIRGAAHEDCLVRAEAVKGLGEVTAKTDEMRAVLLRLLKEDEGHVVKVAALRALVTFPEDDATLDAVIRAVTDKDAGLHDEDDVLRSLKSSKAAQVLVDAVLNGDYFDAQTAASAVRWMGETPLPILHEMLKSKDEVKRARAAELLVHGFSLTPESAKVFAELLDYPDVNIRVRAVELLTHTNPDVLATVVPAMGKALGDESPAVRRRAAQSLTYLPKYAAAPLVPVLREALKDRDPLVRAGAAWGLEHIGLDALPAEPELLELLGDPSKEVRQAVLIAFREIGEPAAPGLIGALGDSRPLARASAAEALGRGCRCSDAAIPALIAAAKDPEEIVRKAAVASLGAYQKPGQEAVEALRQAAADASPEVRAELLKVYSRKFEYSSGPPNVQNLALVMASLDDSAPMVRAEGISSLKKIVGCNPEALAKVFKLLHEDPEPTVRGAAAHCLGRADYPVESVIAELIAATRDPSVSVQDSAVQALGELKARAKVAVPRLIEMLNAGEYAKDTGKEGWNRDMLQHQVVRSLEKIGPDAQEAVPRLAEFLQLFAEGESSSRGWTAQLKIDVFAALKAIGANATATIPSLMKLLESEDENLKISAIHAITVMGPEAKVAIPVLEKLIQNQERAWVSREALEGLRRIDPVEAEKFGKPEN